MSEHQNCPICNCQHTYSLGTLMCCSECFHEWNPLEEIARINQFEKSNKVLDSNGNELMDGDSVLVIKDLNVKGAIKPLKAGTKVKNIKLVDGDHNISCKIDGFGAMALKSEFVKKA